MDQKGRFGADEAAVVLELRFSQVAGQDAVDHALPPVQVLLQLPGIFSLSEELGAFVMEGVLRRRRQNMILLTTRLTLVNCLRQLKLETKTKRISQCGFRLSVFGLPMKSHM